MHKNQQYNKGMPSKRLLFRVVQGMESKLEDLFLEGTNGSVKSANKLIRQVIRIVSGVIL